MVNDIDVARRREPDALGAGQVAHRQSGRGGLAAARKRIFLPFIAPAFVLYVAFLVAPTVVAMWLSLYNWNGLTTRQWLGLRNYTVLFQDAVFLASLRNTVIILVVVGVAVFLFSFVLTTMMRGMRGRSFARSALFFPFMLSPIVLSIIWGIFFQHNGIVNGIFRQIGLSSVEWLAGPGLFRIVLLGVAWISVGLYITIILAGVDQIPRHYYDEAEIAGANALQRFWHVTLPLTWDVISVAAILWTINTLKLFDFIFAFGGSMNTLPPPSIWNSALFVYGETFGGQVPPYRFGYASASAIVMLAVFAVFVVILRRLMRREAVEL